MRYFYYITLFLIVATISLFGFRGKKSLKPPIYLFPDMDDQPKLKAQSECDFWSDHRVERPVPKGTIPRGSGANPAQVFSGNYSTDQFSNSSKYLGKEPSGEWTRGFPLEVTNELMSLGRERYDIFCAACHGKTGSGEGITTKYDLVGVPNYHSNRFREMAEGELYNTIVNGKGQMLGYGDKLAVNERWAVVLYIRALQRANNATIQDVPLKLRSEFEL